MKKNIPILLTFFLLLQLFSPGLISLAATPVKDIEHKLQTKETANMCLREYEGELTFQWPLNKKKVDFVIVQDASGSFQGSIGNVKTALKKIVDQLDPKNDRVMVTSYQDYKGFKGRYNNVLNNSGSGVKTILQSGLNSGIDSAKRGIDKINPNSGTPTASGLQFALQQYEKAKGADDPDRETIFLLVTDGVANVQTDGYIHKKSNQVSDWTGRAWSSEYEQNYESALGEVKEKAQNIKDKGYKLVTAFWENKETLAAPNQYYDKYDPEVGPYSRNALQSMATKPEWFVLSNDIEEFSKRLIETVTQVTKKEKDTMVLDIYNDLQIEDVQVSGPNGLKIKPVVKNNQIIWDLEGQPEGAYTVTYKVKETKPQPNEFDVAGGYLLSYDQKFEIPVIKAKSNPNAINCSNVITKKVSDSDEKLVEAASLKAIDEAFIYDVNYNFGYDVASKKEIILQDDLEDILDVLDTKLTNAEGKEIQVIPVINKEKSIVTYKIPLQNDSYAYLAGQQYKLTIKAKIKRGTNVEVLKKFITEDGIPNTAQLSLDDKPSESNKVVVIPPVEEPKLHKTVSDSDEKNVEEATLSNIKEKFTWNVEYEFGNAPSAYDSIVLSDDLEDILEIIDVKVVNKKGETVNVEPKIDPVSKKVTVELLKKEESYAYLAGETYTIYITSKIADDTPSEEIAKYIAKGGVPNKAELVLDHKPTVSNEVHVKPPTEDPKVTKTVSDIDEKDVEKAKLEAKNEEFTWNIDYKFGNDTAKLKKIVLQDDLEDILDILEVKLVDANNNPIEVTPKIDEKTKEVTIELPKKDGSYAYLAGQTYTMHIQSKISDQASAEEITKYLAKGGIPNKAALMLDNKPTVSNETQVVPPIGQIEIEKVDAADSNVKLKNAVFQIFDKDGNEVDKLTTDENGKATSNQLLFGTYTIKEVQAPDGYMLLREPIAVEITSKTPIKKIQVENSKSDWNIPETGGMGTTIFYVIGIVVMVAALIVFFRKRSNNL
ncbi:isopeptide-forming domain-containing fimbrial protein [Bacillus bingmayongensis]|uniref:isopeptide-forming domain-containing fimbrial protein n=1 Tax=Bacillus bingmayongensis TaxID=1150157 RepID=UPI001C8D59D6|nr:isopeptide-forming domain-containing fimbrial protein [Bacillus bingmayongensis]MBY0598583.1 isopeptide-forming domain-containing fimbrial protein [Bacillus bingmayongensis]